MTHTYTSHDTPEVVERIEADLQLISDTVRRGDPRLRSLVLTGGFARGEGTMIENRPQNDYDLVALRRPGRSARPYEAMRRTLERRLGLHIDLCPVATWRLPFASSSIFWYETGQIGKTLWGDPELLRRIPIQDSRDIHRTEALRLLVNRGAGLLLATDPSFGLDPRMQAAKALLASVDVQVMAAGKYGPTQTQRLEAYRDLVSRNGATPGEWMDWAHEFKLGPGAADLDYPWAAWRPAAQAILDSVPTALRYAGFRSLREYTQYERGIEWLVYQRHASTVPGARRFVGNPTGRIRGATLDMLHDALTGSSPRAVGRERLSPLLRDTTSPLQSLQRLRQATLQ